MILLNRYYVVYIVWLCLYCLLEGISSELTKPKYSLPFKELADDVVTQIIVEERSNPTPRVDLFSNNFTHYSRGRLKIVKKPIKNAPNRTPDDFDKRKSNYSTITNKKLLNTLIYRFSDSSSSSNNSDTNSINNSGTNFNNIDSNNFNDNNSKFSHKILFNENIIALSPSVADSIQRDQLTQEKEEGHESFHRRVPLTGNDDAIPLLSPLPKTGVAAEFAQHRIINPRLFHSRTKRDIRDTWQSESHVHHITVGLNLGERDVLVDLYLNRDLLSNTYFEKVLKNGSYNIQRPKEGQGMCHYQGFIKDVPGSWAAVSTCNGIRGIVFDGEDIHYLEPIPGLTVSPSDPHYHLNHNDLLQTNLTCGYTGRPNHPVRELFHDETFKRLLRYKRETTEGSIRGPFNANALSRYVELVLVADKAEYEKHDSDVNKIYDRCKAIANIVNALYQPLNIFIALVGVEVWQEEDPFEISTDGDKTLTNFLNYRKVRLIPEHPNDNAQLLTGKVFDSGVVGKALKGPICTYQYSGGVNMDHSDSVGLVATTVAHEMGHNFGMEHDTEEDCKCPDKRCIMAPSSGTKSPSHWSSCSHEYLAISFERSMDYCLRNKPTSLFDSPVCGNGFVEAGEQCDCGLEEHCNNPCCNATTCMLFSNATCATGHCCDLQTCRPRPAGMECRPALHECDLPEYCSGDSEYCPDNFYKEDGYQCLGGKAYCYEGMCRTHEHQCRLLWGPTGKNSHDKCYNLNKEGNTHGNCGYNWANNTYKKCLTFDVKCGMMHCKHFNERLEFGMESVSKVSHRFIADKTQGVIPCRVAQVDLGLDMVDPGLAPDGAKCGYNKMCVGQHCLEVAALRKHVCNCHGNGACNNLGNCHCKLGYAWPECKYPGLGGSVDSGPASNPNATSQFVVGMFVFFLGIVPLTVIVLCLVYYVKGNFKIWLMRKGRPINSRLSGVDGRRGSSALRVEIVTKNTADTITDGVPSGIRSPTPPSSQGSKSNSPLLNGHANGAAPNFATLFGRHEGFTLSPIKEKPKGDLPQGQAPSAPPLSEVASSPVTSPSTGRPTCKVKPYSQNVLSPNGSGKPTVDISSPSLQASTNPAVKVVAADSLKSRITPGRQAPQRPKSVPDATTLIMENMPFTSEGNKDQGKQSTVARIASFLSKKERAESAPPDEATKCNTLPRKAAKINRESLLQLEISHPMQLQATELPNNLVPVRPAPDPPMPSNVKPSDIKASQDKGTISKVTWAPGIENKAVDGRVDLPRVGSVKEHSVTTRPPIPKFGSMRAPRPKSLPPPRPSQPPPRPPLPMIPGTPETEYFYDDCITVQINAPLAPEEDGTSPPQESIYATIDEDSPTRDPQPSNGSSEGKKDKKNIFSMLYAKTKKKKAADVDEPLYCNIESPNSTAEDKREASSNTPSPVIADRISCGSADEGGLLSEIVTELVTREPQYMNTLSKKTKPGSPPKQDLINSETPSEKNSTQSSASLSPKSKDTTPPEVEKPKPYVPYSSLKPRGVFNFFGKSNSEEEKSAPKSSTVSTGLPIAQDPVTKSLTPVSTTISEIVSISCAPDKQIQEKESSKKTEYPSNTLAASLAEVKAVSAATKSSFLNDKTSSLNSSSSIAVQKAPNTGSTNSSVSERDSNSQMPKIISPETNVHGSRPRPVFPPDKIITNVDKSGSKSGPAAGSKKIPVVGTVGVAKNKGIVSSIGVSGNIANKSSVAKSSSKIASKPLTTSKQPSSLDKELSSKNVTGVKKPLNPSVFSKPETKPKGIPKEKDTSKSPSEPKPATAKKFSKVTSPNTSKPGTTSSKSGVLAAAAKSGPQGSSHVASLQQKFEKESQGLKPAVKVSAKKLVTAKGSSKPAEK